MRSDLHREGLGGIVVVAPVAIVVWMSSWWNDRGHVGSERGSHTPVHCAWNGRRGEGSCGFPPC
jgi:hypothetical protein